jgi:hypothetical protein
MKANKPYVKQFDENGEVTNEITKHEPFINNMPVNRAQRRAVGKKITLSNPLTGKIVGELKMNGNNRANSSKRGKNSRINNQKASKKN